MGTNFYAKHILTEDERNLIRARMERFMDRIIDLPDVFDDIDVEPVHLGKRSAGWQFLWQTSKYYDANLDSIKEFLNRPDIAIYDEYGRWFTVDEFFNEELKDWLYKDGEHIDGKHTIHKKDGDVAMHMNLHLKMV